jgi:hypothetical protein
MNHEIITQVQKAGFDVYMRDPKDSWLYYTDGTHIGCLQHNIYDGISVSTVHIPNQKTGTGFRVESGYESVGKTILETAFHIPSWAAGTDREASKPFKDIEHFLKADSWNQGYKRVEREIKK